MRCSRPTLKTMSIFKHKLESSRRRVAPSSDPGMRPFRRRDAGKSRSRGQEGRVLKAALAAPVLEAGFI